MGRRVEKRRDDDRVVEGYAAKIISEAIVVLRAGPGRTRLPGIAAIDLDRVIDRDELPIVTMLPPSQYRVGTQYVL